MPMLCDPIYGLPTDPTKSITFVIYISVQRANPNGDPNNGGAPRVTTAGHLWARNASFKRKVRDAAKLKGQKIWMDHGVNLQRSFDPYTRDGAVHVDEAYADLWDLRLFGGTITAEGKTKLWKGKPIRNVGAGPLQVTDAVAVDTTNIIEVGLTRCAHGKETEAGDPRANMGEYSIGEFALLRIDGEYLPGNAHGMVSSADLATFWESVVESYGLTRSAARMGVDVRRVIAFAGPPRGGEPKHVTKERVIARRSQYGDPTSMAEYEIGVDLNGLPGTIECFEWNDGEHRTLAAGTVHASPHRTFSLGA